MDWSRQEWCNQCGLCCRYFDVDVTKEELDRILNLFSAVDQKLFMQKVRQLKDSDLFHWKNPCPFLTQASEKRFICKIHLVKPQMCREWTKEQCEAFLARLADSKNEAVLNVSLDPEDTLDPDSEGSPQDWDTYGTGTGHYDRLADADDGTGIETPTEAEKDYVNIDNLAVTPSVINWVQIHIRARSVGGAKGGETMYIQDKYGVDERSGSKITLDRNQFVEYTTDQYTTQPDGISAWTKAAVDGLQVGALSDAIGSGESIRVSKIWAVVNYEIGVIDKDFSDAGSGSEVFEIPLKTKGFSEVGGGVETFTIPFKAMGFADAGAGADVFEIVYKELGFSDVGLGTDAFTLFLEKYFTDVGQGTDVFDKFVAFINKAFSDIGGGTEIFEKEVTLLPKEFGDVGTALEVFEKEEIGVPTPPLVAMGGRFPPEEKEYIIRLLGQPFRKREGSLPIKGKPFIFSTKSLSVRGRPFRTGEQELPIKGRRDRTKLFWLLFGED